MKFNNDDIIALIGTIVIHVILLLILYFGVLRTVVLGEERTIFLTVGDLSGSVGMYAPDNPTITQQAASPPRTTPQQPRTTPQQQQRTTPQRQTTQPSKTQNERLITQDREETVPIPNDAKSEEEKAAEENTRREREAAEQRQREEAERRQREEEQRRQTERIESQMSVFQRSESQTGGQGNVSAGTAAQGNPFASSSTGSNQGSGVAGSFSLDGRSVFGGGLPSPGYTGQEVGRIVINITVDPGGNVISAEVARGTNIADASMRSSALDAARRAKFSRIQRPDNQTGTITYNYTIRQ
jgi:TonB family protein